MCPLLSSCKPTLHPCPSPHPPQALGCLTGDKNRALLVFGNVTAHSSTTTLAVLACGIVLAAHALAGTAGADALLFPGGGSSSCGGAASPGGGAEGEALRQLCGQSGELLRFLADK